MADNVTLNSGSGGATIKTDDDGTAHWQYVKVAAGADNTQTAIEAGGGTEATALRVTLASDSTGVVSIDDNGSTVSVDDGGGSLTVDGTVAVSGTVAVTDNSGSLTVDNAALAVTGGGVEASALRVTIANDSTGVVSIDDGGSSITVDGTVTANLSATDNAVLDSIDTAVNGTLTVDGSGVTQPVSGTVTVQDGGGSLTVDGSVTADTELTTADLDTGAGTDTRAVVGLAGTASGGAQLIPGSSTDGLLVNLGANNDVSVTGTVAVTDNSGSLTVDDGGGALTVDGTVAATQSGTWNIGTATTVTTVSTLTGGGVAHDGADSGNPHKIGAKAGTSDQTAVATGDRTDVRADTLGHIIVRPYALHENLVQGATAAITTTTSTSVIAAAGAGVRNYITSLTVTNSHASTGTLVTITDGSGGSTLWTGYAASAGGGATVTFPTPLRGSANTAVHAVCGTTGANVYVSASGYKSAV